MYFLKFFSNFIEKSLNDTLKMPSNSLPDADLNIPEMSSRRGSHVCLPLMLLIFMLMNLKPLIKLLLFVPQVKTYLSSLLLEEQTYFQFPSSPVHQRRNQKS